MGAFLFGTVSCVSPGLYCYAGPLAKMGGDIYWYSTKIILNVVNCVTMVIVYLKVTPILFFFIKHSGSSRTLH